MAVAAAAAVLLVLVVLLYPVAAPASLTRSHADARHTDGKQREDVFYFLPEI